MKFIKSDIGLYYHDIRWTMNKMKKYLQINSKRDETWKLTKPGNEFKDCFSHKHIFEKYLYMIILLFENV